MALVVGVDAHNLVHDRRGIGRYARALLSRYARMPQRIRLVLLVPHAWPRLVARRYRAEIGGADVALARRERAVNERCDVVWYPWNGMTWVAPLPKIATVHDVWPFESPAGDLRIRRNEQTPFRATATHATRIVADSAFTKAQLGKHLGVEAERVDVVPLGVDAPPAAPVAPAAVDGYERYVLFVGEVEGRKDLATALAATALLPERWRSTALVIAGRDGRARGDRAAARRGGIIYEGEVDDARLEALYAGAAALVFPSRYEGFGLPVLEAMARGKPVVASSAASIPEAGGDAALYFPPGDAPALASELTRLFESDELRDRLSVAGKARAAEFTWDRCAEATLQIFERVRS